MKLAVFHHLPSGGALWALAQKLRIFIESGHTVKIYTVDSADHDFLRSIFPGVEQKIYRPARRRSLGAYVDLSREIAQEINRSGCDLVYVDKCRLMGSPPLLCFLVRPSLYYMHEPLGVAEYESRAPRDPSAADPSEERYGRLGWRQKLSKLIGLPRRLRIKRWDRRAVLAASRILTCSKFSAEWIFRVYGRHAEVFYQGVDEAFLRAPAGAGPRERALCVGRLENRKRQDFVIEALSRCEKRFSLDVLYDDEEKGYRAEIERKAREKAIEVRFFHRLSRKEIERYYRESVVVLCASRHEPFGFVPLEAMACGTPVIAVDEGGYRETVLHGQTGYLLPRDPRVWAETIDHLAQEPVLGRKLGEAGRRHVQKSWTWAGFSDRFKEIAGEVRMSRQE
ncbi:MAG: glycosyltransferase family 4 protein [Candidatus Omnitrophota bacterium]